MRVRAMIAVLATLFGSLLAAGVIAAIPSVAAASVDTPSSGYIEICKTFAAGPAGSPAYQGTFNYTINDGETRTSASINALEGGPQVCTTPISVPSGTATVTETAAPWFSVASITGTQGDPGSVTAGESTGSAILTVLPAPSPGNESLTTTVQYTNDPVTGVVEVCKQAASNSPSLTGAYSFSVTTADPGVNVFDSTNSRYDLPWTTTASATISAAGLGCSGPITVPAGAVVTVEGGTTYVTAITAESNGWNALIGDPNLNFGTSYETVLAGTTTNQTVVTYTDALSTVKVCKEWAGWPVPATSFPFTASSSGVAGPTAVTGSFGLTAGNCQIIGSVRAGTQVNITEGIIAGTKVGSIVVSPTENSQGASPIVPSSLSLPNRTVSVIAGAGETDVTFTDEPADPGTLKICVAPTTNPAAGSVPFTVNGTQTIDVNLSSTAVQCTLDPTPFPFDSSVTITGGAIPTPDAFSGTPAVVPSMVEVLEGGVPTATNQSSLSASTASSATVLMSEGIVTEVTFTIDPPAVATAPPVTATPTVAQVTASVTPNVSSNASTPPPATVSSVSAEVKRLERQLTSVKAQIKALTKVLSSKHHLTKAARRADQRKLALLRATEARLLRELK